MPSLVNLTITLMRCLLASSGHGKVNTLSASAPLVFEPLLLNNYHSYRLEPVLAVLVLLSLIGLV
ncbi:exported protein of unknown function [Nitrospira moscoviensis]|uniref:Uncharacterized protein n=1 Tax=Nitrospira moscoviensis TaxID=42253 RepID=A0A0K2GH01_NITMO|nr:exported protein of unknown function [Nitrospira moscoviensis]